MILTMLMINIAIGKVSVVQGFQFILIEPVSKTTNIDQIHTIEASHFSDANFYVAGLHGIRLPRTLFKGQENQ